MKKLFPFLFSLAIALLFFGIAFGLAGAIHFWMFIVSSAIFLLVFSISGLICHFTL